MADRFISFSGPMVRALLASRKTQTRRVLKPQPFIDNSGNFCVPDRKGKVWNWGQHLDGRPCVRNYIAEEVKYQVGDRLWVREAWQTHAAYDDLNPASMGGEEPVCYEADGAHQTWGYPAISKIGRRRAGMFMPRWASRLTLTVTDVRVQRLQEISGHDAEAEGVFRHVAVYSLDKVFRDQRGATAIQYYRNLWDSLNAKRGYGWATNPWVVAVSFRVERRNIDAEVA